MTAPSPETSTIIASASASSRKANSSPRVGAHGVTENSPPASAGPVCPSAQTTVAAGSTAATANAAGLLRAETSGSSPATTRWATTRANTGR